MGVGTTTWGTAVGTGGNNGLRLGYRIDPSYPSDASATLRLRIWAWTRSSVSDSSNSFNVSGGWPGRSGQSRSIQHPISYPHWDTRNQTLLYDETITVSRQYGSSVSRSFSASFSGIEAAPGTASVSGSVTVDARPFLAPNAPSGLSVSRSSDTRHTVSWSASPTDSRPVSSFRVQRRVYDGGWSSWSTRQSNISGSSRSWVDRTEPNRAYEWRVVAVGPGETATSGSSDTVWTSPWHAAEGVWAQSVAAGVRVRWTDLVRYGSAEWQVQHRAGGGSWSTVGTVASQPRGTLLSFTHVGPDLAVTHQYRVRSRTTSGPLLSSEWVESNVVALAAPPSAPTNLGPSSPWDASEDRVLTWRHVPTDGSEQTAFQVRHRLQGGSWTTEPRVDSDVSSWTLPAGTYANGDVVEWQVRTWGVHPDPSPYSASNLQSPVARPTVAINSPEQDETIELSSVLVEWGFDQEQGGVQSAWRLSLEAGGTVVQERSGSGPGTSFQLANLADGAEYTLTVRVQSGGLWSEPDSVSFSVDYLSPQAPSISVDWDVAVGAASVTFVQPVWDEDHAEPSHHQLWRAIDDGPWLLIADDIPVGSTVSDPIPAMGDGHVNYYRATTVSVLPSTADSEVVTLTVPSVGKGGTQGWVYLNGGPGMTQVCRVRANAERADNEGVAHTVRHFAGRPDPVAYFGTARTLTWDVSARIAPDFDGASTRAELVALQAAGTPICYRDPTGARWFGVMGPISSSWRSIIGEVSFSFTRVDAVEGLDVVQRLPGELEPAL